MVSVGVGEGLGVAVGVAVEVSVGVGLGVNVAVQSGVKVKVGCGVLKRVGVGVGTCTINLPAEHPKLTIKPASEMMAKKLKFLFFLCFNVLSFGDHITVAKYSPNILTMLGRRFSD